MSLKNKLSTERDGRQLISDVGTRISRYMAPKIELYHGERLAQFGFLALFVFVLLGLFGPELAPYDPSVTHRSDAGATLRIAEPSADHWLGTTNTGKDVLSHLIHGARVSVTVGFFAAFIAVFVGTNVALISAYYGGIVDDILMRITDIVYGLPFIPFVLTLVYILGPDIQNIIIGTAAVMWRSSARSIRSEVLSQRERPYVESAQAIGASDARIIYRHIFPNVLPLTVLYMAFAVAYAVIAEASIAFLGFGDPELYSWGTMIFQAYTVGAIRFAWWWVIPPGVCIMVFVMSVFFIGRTLEEYTNPELRH